MPRRLFLPTRSCSPVTCRPMTRRGTRRGLRHDRGVAAGQRRRGEKGSVNTMNTCESTPGLGASPTTGSAPVPGAGKRKIGYAALANNAWRLQAPDRAELGEQLCVAHAPQRDDVHRRPVGHRVNFEYAIVSPGSPAPRKASAIKAFLTWNDETYLKSYGFQRPPWSLGERQVGRSAHDRHWRPPPEASHAARPARPACMPRGAPPPRPPRTRVHGRARPALAGLGRVRRRRPASTPPRRQPRSPWTSRSAWACTRRSPRRRDHHHRVPGEFQQPARRQRYQADITTAPPTWPACGRASATRPWMCSLLAACPPTRLRRGRPEPVLDGLPGARAAHSWRRPLSRRTWCCCPPPRPSSPGRRAGGGEQPGDPGLTMAALVLALVIGFILSGAQRRLTRRTNRTPARCWRRSCSPSASYGWRPATRRRARTWITGSRRGSGVAGTLAQASIGVQQIRGGTRC